MIIITGGAGFIGSNLLAALNSQGRDDILIVDDLTDGTKFRNLAPYQYYDYMDKTEFLHRIQADQTFAKRIDQVFHEGACSDTTEWDGKYMMENNYAYSKAVLKYCLARQIPFLYASSAAVYGGNTSFVEAPEYEAPLNVYAYSKLLFDNHVRRILPTAQSQIVGFRYFNVYGPQEQHKGTMASMAYHFSEQLIKDNETRLFEGSDGFGNGEQRRDFVFVGDVAAVNLWFMRHTDKSGIFNVGTGRSQSFNEMADAVIACHGSGTKRYIPFPDHLKGCYQSFTEADLSKLRAAGCDVEFHDVAVGVAKTMAVENDGDPEAAEAAEGVDSVGSAPVVESSLHVRKVQEA